MAPHYSNIWKMQPDVVGLGDCPLVALAAFFANHRITESVIMYSKHTTQMHAGHYCYFKYWLLG